MVQLYIDEYAKNLVGQRVCIACREGILRDHFRNIVADIKFLARHGIDTSLFHNLPNRFANQKLVRKLEMRLPGSHLIRIAPDLDFYEAVLDHPDTVHKLIFLERRYLTDHRGNKINTLTTSRVREVSADFGELIANVNFRDNMNLLCEKIEAGLCERIHILPAAKNTIKHELFTIEGSGTMIANNFEEDLRQVQSDDDVAIVHRILTMYKRSGFLKPRTKSYLNRNRHQFYVTSIDGIVVGCLEKKVIDERTVELGALAISERFRNQRVGVFTVNAFTREMENKGFDRFISLTRNPRLQALLLKLGFSRESPPEYSKRQGESPDVTMYYKTIGPTSD